MQPWAINTSSPPKLQVPLKEAVPAFSHFQLFVWSKTKSN